MQDSSVLGTWSNQDTLDDHVNRHAADFGIDPLDPYAKESYAAKAREFLQRSFDEGLQTKIENDGYMRVYDPESNMFGAYNPDTTTRTFFNPPDGQSYFDKQPGTLYIDGKPVEPDSISSNSPRPVNASAMGNPEPAVSAPPVIEPVLPVAEPIPIVEPIIIP